MVKRVGSDDDSEFDSVTSSQKSFLKNCPFADPLSRPSKSSDEMVETDAESTEILGNQISPSVAKTPILSFSSPTSQDSINDEDVFRTPPENASLSSSAAADSEPRVRVSKLKSPSSKTETTPVSASVTEVVVSLSSPASVPANSIRVPGKHSPSTTAIGKTRVSKLKSHSSRTNSTHVSASPPSLPSENIRVPGNHSPFPTAIGKTTVSKSKSSSSRTKSTPVSASPPSLPAENVRVLSDFISEVALSHSSPASVPAKDVRVPRKQHSPSPTAIAKNKGLKNQPISGSVGITGAPKSASPALNLAGSSGKITETENSGGDLPFKEIMEALLRNSGENLSERDEKVSCFDILKKCGFKFP